jgi:hypothetical protein
MAKIERLRPATHQKAADAIQVLLDLGLPLAPETKADLLDAFVAFQPEPWPFIMVNPASARDLVRRIRAGDDPGLTLAVWIACLSFAEYGTNVVAAGRHQIAEAVGTSPQEASRALARLAGMDVLERVGRGRYRINPATAWRGSLEQRARAGQDRKLEAIDGGKGRPVPAR